MRRGGDTVNIAFSLSLGDTAPLSDLSPMSEHEPWLTKTLHPKSS